MNRQALRRLASDWTAIDHRTRLEMARRLQLVGVDEEPRDLNTTVWARAKAQGRLDLLRVEVDRERNRLRAVYGGRPMPDVPRRRGDGALA